MNHWIKNLSVLVSVSSIHNIREYSINIEDYEKLDGKTQAEEYLKEKQIIIG